MKITNIRKAILCATIVFTFITSINIIPANADSLYSINIDEYELKKDDKSEIEPGDSIKFADQLKLGFSYTIPEGTVVDEAAHYQIPLPNNLIWPTILINKTIPIQLQYTDMNGVSKETTLANLNIETDETYLKYESGINDILKELGDLQVQVKDLDLNVQLDKNAIQNAEEVSISLGNGKKLKIAIDDNKIIQPNIESKNVTYKDGIFSWIVEIKAGNRTFANYKMRDLMSDNQEFIDDSFTVNGTKEKVSQTVNEENKTVLQYTFPSLSSNQTIKYDTKVKVENYYNGNSLKNVDSKFDNKAELYDDNGAIISSKDKTYDLQESWLQKTGKVVDNGKNIQWTLVINAMHQGGLDVQVYDVIDTSYLSRPSHLTSVKINGIEAALPNVTQGFTYHSLPDKNDHSNDGITFNIPNINGLVEVVYKTAIDPSYYENNNNSQDFKNNAWLDVAWDPEGDGTKSNFVLPIIEKGSVPVPTSLITKSVSKQYDPVTQLIVWDISVNDNKINMSKAIVSDIIQDGQIYVSHTESDERFKSVDVSNPQEPLFNLGNIGENTRSFTITTKVIDTDFIASNRTEKIKNVANLDYRFGNDGIDYSASSSPTTEAKSDVLKKKAIAYDYEKQEQTWEIVVNTNAMELKDVMIKDIIPEGQTFIEGSLLLDQKIMSNSSSDASYYEMNSANLLIYLRENVNSNKIQSQHILTLKTKIDVNKIEDIYTKSKVIIKNRAELYMREYPTVNFDATSQINNELVSKLADTSNVDKGYVRYQVKLNQNRVILKDKRTLTDTLSKGLQLDLDSIHLYYANVDSDGTLHKGVEVIKSDYTYAYTAKDKNSVLTFTFKEDIDDAYILEYVADISGTGTLGNAISLEGTNEDLSSSASITIKGNASAEAATRRKGKISVTLYEEGTTNPLNNCSFSIMIDGNIVQQITSDASGKVTFSLLNLNKEYTIVQNTTKDGYLKTEGNLKVKVSTTDLVEKTVYNQVVVGDITFQVKDMNGNPIKDSEFEIFNKNDTTFQHPLDARKSDEFGNITFPDMPYGEYVIKQKNSPTGYEKLSSPFYTSIDGNGMATPLKTTQGTTLDFVENAFIDGYGCIKVVLKNEEGSPLANTTFEIMTQNGILLMTGKTDADGFLCFSPLAQETYIIKQISCILDYEMLVSTYEAKVISKQETIVEAINVHKKKTDIESPSYQAPPTGDSSKLYLYFMGLLSGGYIIGSMRRKYKS